MTPAPMTDTWPFTVAQFAVMAIFALLAIAGIVYGMRLKRRRAAATEELEQHRDAAGDGVQTAETSEPDAAPQAAEAALPRPPAEARTITPPPATAADTAPLAGEVTQLKGLGPKLAATLAGLGVTRIDQIAAMDAGQLDALDAQLGAFRGRPARDRWAEQARLLMAGDRAAYEAEFGRLGG